MEQKNIELQSKLDSILEDQRKKDELLKSNQVTILHLQEAKTAMEKLVEAEKSLSNDLRSRNIELNRVHSCELGRRMKAEEILVTVFNIVRSPHHP